MKNLPSVFLLPAVISVLLSAHARVPAEVLKEHGQDVNRDDVEDHDVEESSFEYVKRIYLDEKVNRSTETRNVYDDSETTLEYGWEEGETRHPAAEGGGSEERVYDSPPSQTTAQVLGSDRKETRFTVTDQVEDVYDAEINLSENKTFAFGEENVETQFLTRQDLRTVDTKLINYNNHDYINSETILTSNDEVSNSASQTVEECTPSTLFNLHDEKQDFLSHQDKHEMNETFAGAISEEETELSIVDVTARTENFEFSTNPVTQTLGLADSSQLRYEINVTLSTENPIPGKSEHDMENKLLKSNPILDKILENESATTDTTITTTILETKPTTMYNASEARKTVYFSVIENENNESSTNVETLLESSNDSSDEVFLSRKEIILGKEHVDLSDNSGVVEIPPSAERLYSSYMERYDIDNTFSDKTSDLEEEKPLITSQSQALRDYEDKSHEDSVVIKSLLEDYPSFKKEKIEPGTLIEECADCDIRILPIRPAQQRSTPEFETESPPKARIKFSELPEGAELQITKLGLSDGIFLFSYLSQFLSWIQPNEFPVGKCNPSYHLVAILWFYAKY